jgi:hypothetical protein
VRPPGASGGFGGDPGGQPVCHHVSPASSHSGQSQRSRSPRATASRRGAAAGTWRSAGSTRSGGQPPASTRSRTRCIVTLRVPAGFVEQSATRPVRCQGTPSDPDVARWLRAGYAETECSHRTPTKLRPQRTPNGISASVTGDHHAAVPLKVRVRGDGAHRRGDVHAVGVRLRRAQRSPIHEAA